MSSIFVFVLKVFFQVGLFLYARDGIINKRIVLQTSPTRRSGISLIRYMEVVENRAVILGIILGLISVLATVVFWFPLNTFAESSWFIYYIVVFLSVVFLALGIIIYTLLENLTRKLH